jgi:hypothetical protein
VKVFFDTNVILDGYYQWGGHASSDEAIEQCKKDGPLRGWIAWHTISNTYYLVRNHSKSSDRFNHPPPPSP